VCIAHGFLPFDEQSQWDGVVNVEPEPELGFVFLVRDSTDRAAVVVAFEGSSALSVPAVPVVCRNIILDIDVVVLPPTRHRTVLGIQRLPSLEGLFTAGTGEFDLSPSRFPGTVVRTELSVTD
jgi:hypothetical protein